MKFSSDFKRVERLVSMNFLFSFQFCLNFGNLCILSRHFKYYKGGSCCVVVLSC